MDLPKGNELIGCKRVFTVKHQFNGLVESYKIRLVAKRHT